ncbi:hypothetical protein HII13_004552 [Brettanomyces bruxellensis]|nr:hypothetical protein HII13_004552 [Brettanomyces bruxellensis]
MTVQQLSTFQDTDLSDHKKIWATLITNDKYVPGLLTLDYSLKRSKSKYPLVAMYTEQIDPDSLNAIAQRGIPIHRIHKLKPAKSPELSNDPRFNECWSKLYAFKLTQFERVVEMDSDMVVTQNMDELMDIPLSSGTAFAAAPACVCNPFKLAHYPHDWVPSNCSFTEYEKKKISGINPRDPFWEVMGPSAELGLKTCNGGLVVIKPSKTNYQKILETLQNPEKTATYKFTDQELLSDIFEGHWLCLSYVYNSLKSFTSCHPDIWDLKKIKNIHYILTPKPWQVDPDQYDDTTGTFSLWWSANEERKRLEKKLGLKDFGS